MNIAEIEASLRVLSEKPFDPATFPLRILEIYDAPRATVTKLQNGSMNKGERPGDLLWKGKLFFRASAPGQSAATVDEMKLSNAVRLQKPRFLFACDGAESYCYDTKADEGRALPIQDLGDLFDFMLPLAGIERYQAAKENPADIKAAGRLARLYDAILDCNPDWKKPERAHALNLFMTRLLFCMFAEDTGILEAGLFSSAINEFTKEDGSNTGAVLKTIFDVMDVKERTDEHPGFAQRFPYVNGGLFRTRSDVPVFSKQARRLLIEAARLTWSEINPDIFGSMIQGVVDKALRADLGMHYTSVPNILKLLRPLFIDDLEREFAAAHGNGPQLSKLLTRLYRIRVFDPACGSGNFLIIAYREMRRLEMRIFLRLKELSKQFTLPMSQVRLSQFYGIEYADFAAETAKLSLWIAEHQLNKEFEQIIGPGRPALPLQDSGNIECGNATRLSWLKVCPATANSETYIVGNPPYLGRGQQTDEQKSDMQDVFDGVSDTYGNMDYVACWMIKASDYIQRAGGQFAFVTTNSICQGEHVALLWPLIFRRNQELVFAHQAFKWKNSAASNAGVTCVIAGVGTVGTADKLLFNETSFKKVKNINPYLVDAPTVIVTSKTLPTSDLPRMNFGSMSNDGGHLIFSPEEMRTITTKHPDSKRLFKRIFGAQEFIKGIERWCLWLDKDNVADARAVPAIKDRLDLCAEYRGKSKRPATSAWAGVPHLFIENRHEAGELFFVPQVSSEKRHYLPCGYLPTDSLVIAPHFAIVDAPHFVMGLLSSRMHALWCLAVGGGLETRIRYSNTLIYNTFPVPDLSAKQKEILSDCAWQIVEERENNPGSRISDLYDPDKMPSGLLKAHQDLDVALETIYRGRPFKTDEERLEHLFKLYAARHRDEVLASSGRAA